jgi:hypothetical protein
MPEYEASKAYKYPRTVPAGKYRVGIIEAWESINRSGNETIELKLRTQAGSILFDELEFAQRSYWKIDAFLASIGEVLVPGEEVEVCAEDLSGRSGMAHLVVVEADGHLRNKVLHWLPPVLPETPAS